MAASSSDGIARTRVALFRRADGHAAVRIINTNYSSKRVALFYHKDVAAHTFEPWPHIEKKTRCSDVHEHLTANGVLQLCVERLGREATNAELLTVHTQRHVDEVRRMTSAARDDPTNRTLREPDGPGGVYYSAEADRTARLACGSVIDAAYHVLRHPSQRAFALVRPPGHHAGYDDTPDHRAEGFCFYNSVAVAAGCILSQTSAKRVAILDWDVHHGNGTQRLFEDNPNVLYISLHRFGDNWYPLSGGLEEVGIGSGAGFNLNIPWTDNGLGYSDYKAAFTLIVLPVLLEFQPDLVLLSAGFDAAEGDAQGRMKLTPQGFGALTTMLLRALGPAMPIAAALEGGYNSQVTCDCCEAVIKALSGEEAAEPQPQRLHKCCEPVLRAVVRTQMPHWQSLAKQNLKAIFEAAKAQGMPERASKRQKR